MAQYVFITKTRWDEPPRLRHQLALLLAEAGHEVIFFQKPRPPWSRLAAARRVHARITVVEYHELIHHKLRLLSGIHWLNAWLAARSIRAGLRANKARHDAAIVNFNYEYFFVQKLAGDGPIITVINDDHVATALFGWRRPLEWALEKTCRASNQVMTVSSPLMDQLGNYCKPVLFRPWADTTYRPPAAGRRDVLLFWGFLNDRIDFDRLEELADTVPHFRIMLAGPVQGAVGHRIRRLKRWTNIELRGTSALDGLPVDAVLAGLIPYRSGSDRINAIELSNKALQLLARGLPLLISGMPRFIDRAFVYRLDDENQSPPAVVARIEKEFEDTQGEIAEFVAANTAAARLRQFLEITGQ